jgi:hypothetical protein
MFAGKAEAYLSEIPFRCSTQKKEPGLTHKPYTRLERLARDTHSSILPKSVNYGGEKVYTIGPRSAIADLKEGPFRFSIHSENCW